MTRVAIVRALVCAALVAPLARADDEFDALSKEFREARAKWYEKIQAASADGKAFNMVDRPEDPAVGFAPRFRDYAQKHAGKTEAIAALCWLINDGGQVSLPGAEQSAGKWALARLTRDHAADATIGKQLPRLRYAAYTVGREPLIELYERVIKKNGDKDARAWATFNLGCSYYEQRGAEGEVDKEAEKKRGIALFRRTVKEYAGTKAAQRAEGFVFAAERLQIGMVAPEIVGTDVDRNEIKLSQFRGQVVVLGFWGFW